ncbi:MAG: 50S ribosomal protein L9 [Gammaproteobacteria bacterium]|nr:50S ribosomal protein L9 [Gammaproteobacteria bacterium]MCW8987826.1 50S ribosomal protein L9 [Gammaproteobacteria bacterium]MCW9031018.1 50S ribosomal protein L9 [Gammaproteobacteria bacterium]
MEVILLERVANLGNLGDRVTVRGGYGRNFLVPGKKAVPANEANIAEFESRRAELEKAAAEVLATAQSRAEAVAAVASITIKANAADEGKLFGSIGVTDIVDALSAAGVEVERREVSLPEAIHHVGEYEVSIQLHSDVTQNIQVIVEAE